MVRSLPEPAMLLQGCGKATSEWPDGANMPPSNTLANLTPADRQGSVQVSPRLPPPHSPFLTPHPTSGGTTSGRGSSANSATGSAISALRMVKKNVFYF